MTDYTGSSTTDHLDPDSEAKATLIRRYVSIYLNILERAPGTTEVHVIDLFCGEGVYADGKKGTAVQLAEAVVDHHYSNDRSANRIRLLLNDIGMSEIELGREKIERVRDHCTSLSNRLPERINIEYSKEDAVQVARREQDTHKGRADLKRLYIIDPGGYSQFPIREVIRLMQSNGTEVFLFLTNPQMYQFAQSTTIPPILKVIFSHVWPEGMPEFESEEAFIEGLIQGIDLAMGLDVYTTPVELRKTARDTYLLLHFTKSLRGLEKMVDEVWRLDPGRGKGFRPDLAQGELFTATHSFADILWNHIPAVGRIANKSIAVFTLTKMYRLTHATQVLKALKRDDRISAVRADDGKEARGFYLSRSGWIDNPVWIARLNS